MIKTEGYIKYICRLSHKWFTSYKRLLIFSYTQLESSQKIIITFMILKFK